MPNDRSEQQIRLKLEEYLDNSFQGRKNMGESIPVDIYRMLQYSLKIEIMKVYGREQTINIFRAAGFNAGVYFTVHMLDPSLPFGEFVSGLQRKLEEYKMGILRIEHQESKTGKIILTIAEDADCSGLSVIGESVCNYDEGFIAGIFTTYTNRLYEAVEINCWALGDRVCRFEVRVRE